MKAQVQTRTKEEAQSIIQRIEEQIHKVIIGQDDLIRRILIALFGRIPYSFKKGQEEKAGSGHVLLEGVPGLAKTLLVSAIASTIDAKFQRIQFTPDMLPADILGTKNFDSKTGQFRTEKGPIFANIILADEINRAPQKTQSALLEAMQERQVTIGENTYALEDPFWVLATQNPVEQEGVFSLPEAQLDRFSMMLRVGYPDHDEEVRMLQARLSEQTIERRVSPGDVTRLRAFVRDAVFVDEKIVDYIVRLGRATRAPADVGRPALGDLLVLGVSPRSYQHVLALARVTAFLHGRTYVLPADVKEIYCDAARHRIARSIRAQAENVDPDEILGDILQAVAIP